MFNGGKPECLCLPLHHHFPRARNFSIRNRLRDLLIDIPFVDMGLNLSLFPQVSGGLQVAAVTVGKLDLFIEGDEFIGSLG